MSRPTEDELSEHPALVKRAEMIPLVPLSSRRVLDVGCSAGGFGSALRDSGFRGVLWGIEPTIDEHEFGRGANASSYDRYVSGAFPDDVPDGERFDCIVFNDVLEHMTDPWDVLAWAGANVLEPDGVVVSSIPNIRYAKVLWDLVVRGNWTYRDRGILDRTHLRFFTRSTIIELFERTGFAIDTITSAVVPTAGRRGLAWKLLRPGGREFLVQQYAVQAHLVGPRLDPADRASPPETPG